MNWLAIKLKAVLIGRFALCLLCVPYYFAAWLYEVATGKDGD